MGVITLLCLIQEGDNLAAGARCIGGEQEEACAAGDFIFYCPYHRQEEVVVLVNIKEGFLVAVGQRAFKPLTEQPTILMMQAILPEKR